MPKKAATECMTAPEHNAIREYLVKEPGRRFGNASRTFILVRSVIVVPRSRFNSAVRDAPRLDNGSVSMGLAIS